MVHLLPVVLREIDDLKRGGKTEQLREAARRADRRLKGLRDNGDVLSGVRVAGEVHAVFEHVEPRDNGRLVGRAAPVPAPAHPQLRRAAGHRHREVRVRRLDPQGTVLPGPAGPGRVPRARRRGSREGMTRPG